MDSILTMGTSSYAHTYGNIVEAVKMDILSKFPENYFKYIHVSSQLAFRELKKFKDNSMIEFRKQERPKIYIKPTFEITDDSIPFYGTLLTTHTNSGTGVISKQSLMPIFADLEKHIELDYRMNRDKVSFDVTIQVETLIRQLDLYKNMQNMISWETPYTKIFSLESMIPRQMIEYIAKNANIDLENSTGSIPSLINYMQLHGRYPITYKIRNSSSLDEFFMYYEVPVLISYSDFSVDEGNKNNMVDESYGISFRVTCEFNHPGAYVIRSIEGYPDIIPAAIRIDTNDQKELIPLYTLDRLFEDKNEVMNGFRLYFVTSFKTEEKYRNNKDFIELNNIIDVPCQKILKKYVFSHIPDNVLMRSQVFSDNKQLDYGEDYYIDWNLMKLFINKSNPDVTYRVLFYANMTKFQEEFKTLIEIEKRDKTIDNLSSNNEIHDYWRDRENELLIEANGDYFMPYHTDGPIYNEYTKNKNDEE